MENSEICRGMIIIWCCTGNDAYFNFIIFLNQQSVFARIGTGNAIGFRPRKTGAAQRRNIPSLTDAAGPKKFSLFFDISG